MRGPIRLIAGVMAAVGATAAPDLASSQIPLPIPVPGLGSLLGGGGGSAQTNKPSGPTIAASTSSDAARDETACETGGVLGGVLGGSIFKNNPLGSQAGALGGCLIAKGIARQLTKNERVELQTKTEAAFEGGESTTTYESEDAHKTVTLTRGEEVVQPKNWQIDALSDVTPPHDGFNVVAKTYFARRKVNLRAFTSTDAEIIGSFRPNEAVYVMGRTYDGAWNLIGSEHVLVGYAATNLFASSPVPASAAKAKPAAKPTLNKGQTVTDATKAKVTVSTNTTCSQVKQQVGTSTGLITGCKSPNGGWDLA